MKTLVLFGLCAGAIATSAVAEEGDESHSERKRPHPERKAERGEKGKDHRGGRQRRPPFGGHGDMFRRMDKDGDGNITKEEFLADPRLERLPIDKRETIFARLDGDGDGVLSREEIRVMRKDVENRAKRELRGLDKDENGGVSFEEFSAGRFLGKLPEEKRRQIFKRMDTDGSGEITAEDRPKGPPRRKEHPVD